MFHDAWKAVAAAAIVVLIMALLPPAVFGPHPPTSADYKQLGDGWATIVYNYQTLITGLLAVGAAFITILVSQRSHNQIVALTLRSDKMRIEQALVPHYYFLRYRREELADCNALLAGVPDKAALERLLNSQARWLEATLGDMSRMLGAKGFVAGEMLFDGEMLFVIETVRAQIKDLEEPVEFLRVSEEAHTTVVWNEDELRQLVGRLKILERYIEICLSQMRKLAADYRIELNHDVTPLQQQK